jgi:hypothetical protein
VSSGAGSGSSRTGTRGGGASREQSAGNGKVDTDGLLAALFPSGIPARRDVIRRVNAWLDEAERLASLR